MADGSCVGASRDTSFSFTLNNLPAERAQFQPGATPFSSIFVYGHSFTGYAVMGHLANWPTHHQRPALLNVRYYSKNYNTKLKKEVIKKRFVLIKTNLFYAYLKLISPRSNNNQYK